MKALLINPKERKVTEIELDGSLDSYYKAMDCTTFAVPIQFDNDDALYVDDDGVFKPRPLYGFKKKEWEYAIFGNAIIVGTDAEGNSIDCKSKPEDFNDLIFGVY